MSIAAASRYGAVSVVADGDGYVLGNTATGEFVAVPAIGGEVLRWLRGGTGIEECTRRAAEIAGEPVDVAGFLAGLTAAGILDPEPPSDDAVTAVPGTAHTGTAEPDVSRADAGGGAPGVARRRVGRLLFGPAGLTVQGLLACAAVGAMIAVPATRPASRDAVPSTAALLNVVLLAVAGTALGMVHECAHVLGAWAAGVSARISVSRRMIAIALQTDLTRLWSVPRRARIVPLAAGMLTDAALIGLAVLGELLLPSGTPAVPAILRAVVFLNLTAITYQFLIFFRTDVYALFLLASGCRNLWATKGALARRVIGRTTADDETTLATAGAREIRWARVFLLLYLPGVACTGWYFLVFALPAVVRLVGTAAHTLVLDGPLRPGGVTALAALAITAASTAFVLRGLTRTGLRLVRLLVTRRAG